MEKLDQLSARTRAAKDHLAHVQTSELDPAEGFVQLNALVSVRSADRIVELSFDNCIVDVLHLHSPVKSQAGSRVSYDLPPETSRTLM